MIAAAAAMGACAVTVLAVYVVYLRTEREILRAELRRLHASRYPAPAFDSRHPALMGDGRQVGPLLPHSKN